MYCWTLLSRDISEVPSRMGVTGDLADAMRVCGQQLIADRAFLGCIEAVRPAMSAHNLDSCYARTGRIWVGRRTADGAVNWEERDGYSGEDLLSLLTLT